VSCLLLIQNSVLVFGKEDEYETEMWSFPTVYVPHQHACLAHIVAPRLAAHLGFDVIIKERLPVSPCASLHTQTVIYECEPDIKSRDIRGNILLRTMKIFQHETETAWVSPEGIGSLKMDIRNRLVRIAYWQRQAEFERAPAAQREVLIVCDNVKVLAPPSTPLPRKAHDSAPQGAACPVDSVQQPCILVNDAELAARHDIREDVLSACNITEHRLNPNATECKEIDEQTIQDGLRNLTKAIAQYSTESGSHASIPTVGHARGPRKEDCTGTHKCDTSSQHCAATHDSMYQVKDSSPEKVQRAEKAGEECAHAGAEHASEEVGMRGLGRREATHDVGNFAHRQHHGTSGHTSDRNMLQEPAQGRNDGLSNPVNKSFVVLGDDVAGKPGHGSAYMNQGSPNATTAARPTLAPANACHGQHLGLSDAVNDSWRQQYKGQATSSLPVTGASPSALNSSSTDGTSSLLPRKNVPRYEPSTRFTPAPYKSRYGTAGGRFSFAHASNSPRNQGRPPAGSSGCPHGDLIGKLAYRLSAPPHKLCAALSKATREAHNASAHDTHTGTHNKYTASPFSRETDSLESGGLLDVLENAIKGRRAATRHLKSRREFTIHGLARVPADELTFVHTGTPAAAGQNVSLTVAEYFQERYAPLRYPGMPCVLTSIQPRNGTYVRHTAEASQARHAPLTRACNTTNLSECADFSKAEAHGGTGPALPGSAVTYIYYPLEVVDLLDDVRDSEEDSAMMVEDEYLLGTEDEAGVPSALIRSAWEPCDTNPMQGAWLPISSLKIITAPDGSVKGLEVPQEEACELNETTLAAWIREKRLTKGAEAVNMGNSSIGTEDQQVLAGSGLLWKFVQNTLQPAVMSESDASAGGVSGGEDDSEARALLQVDQPRCSDSERKLRHLQRKGNSEGSRDVGRAADSESQKVQQSKLATRGVDAGTDAAKQEGDGGNMLCAVEIEGGRDGLRELWRVQDLCAAKGLLPVGGPQIGEDGRLTEGGRRMVEGMLRRVVQRGEHVSAHVHVRVGWCVFAHLFGYFAW
jgi:hypothetical protein